MKTIFSLVLNAWLVVNIFSPALASEAKTFTPLRLDGQHVKWGETKLGSPARVTYAFVREPVSQGDARNCRSMENFQSLAERSGTSVREILGEAAAAFRLWEQVSGIVFEETEDVATADILVGAQSRPRGFAFTNVKYASEVPGPRHTPLSGDRGLNRPGSSTSGEVSAVKGVLISKITRSAVCLNPAHKWKVGFDGDLKSYDLRYTFAHEIGHAIGLDHHLRHSSIMHFKYQENFRTLQPGDIEGARWLYGPRID